MPKFKAECVIEMSCAEFWALKENEEFHKFQDEHLSLKTETIKTWEDETTVFTTERVTPNLPIPGVVKSLLMGLELTYEDTHEVPKKVPPYKSKFTTVPPVLQGQIQISGSVRLVSMSRTKCKQVLEGEAEVGIMGVGGSISGYIIDNIQSSYEALPGVVEAWKAAQAEKAGAAAE